MAYALKPTAPIPLEIRRVVIERLDEAIATLEGLDHAEPDAIETAVHDVRKRCKEVRAVARLVRSSIGDEFGHFNHTVRDAASTLAPIRDAHAVLATFDDLRATRARFHDRDLSEVREGHADAADEATRTIHGGDERIDRAHTLLQAAHKRVNRWKLDDGFAALEVGIGATYRSGRKALDRALAKPTDDRLHEWRKSAKRLWYQVRLIEPAAPSILSPLVSTLGDLADALGDDHDLAVLIERLAADPQRFGGKQSVKRATRLARLQQDDLRRRAFRLGDTVYAESATAFSTRLATYWECTVNDGPELPTGGIAELAMDEARSSMPDGLTPGGRTIERERKYLVARVPDLPDEGTTLRQGYLAVDGTVSARIRDAGGHRFTLTIKAGRGAVRTEIDLPLNAEQFEAAWEHTGSRRIHKTRYRIPLGEHVADLDVFHDELVGFALVEVEFLSDAAMDAFEPPDWFGEDVTDDVTYTNSSLSVTPPPTL